MRILLLMLAACGSDPAAPSPRDSWDGGDSFATEQSAGACPASATTLRGAVPQGQPCTRSIDCIPSCCTCGATPRTWLAAACAQGVCADITSTCDGTRADSVCR
jgi:hypothetical protein